MNETRKHDLFLLKNALRQKNNRRHKYLVS